MKIKFFEIKGWEKKHLQASLKEHDLFFYKEPLTENNISLAKDADIISVFIYSKINKKVLNSLKNLKLICTRSTGYDHISIGIAKKNNVRVCNIPSYGENTVAEHTFALILALSRNIHKSYVKILRNDFSLEGLMGFDLKNKTLGVVGAGKIGLHVIRIAKSFGMNVVAFDVNEDNFISEVLDFKYVGFKELLKKSDIVSLHAPHNEKTHHMINKDTVKLMKRGSFIINTSRGGLIDLDALIMGLDKNIIAGAGLDVIEGEEFIKEEKQLLYDSEKAESALTLAKDHILFDNEKVIFTPHIAFYSHEALLRILKQTSENIKAFVKGNNFNKL